MRSASIFGKYLASQNLTEGGVLLINHLPRPPNRVKSRLPCPTNVYFGQQRDKDGSGIDICWYFTWKRRRGTEETDASIFGILNFGRRLLEVFRGEEVLRPCTNACL